MKMGINIMVFLFTFIVGIYLLMRNEQVFKVRNRIIYEIFKVPFNVKLDIKNRYDAISYHKMIFSLKSVKRLEKEIIGEEEDGND